MNNDLRPIQKNTDYSATRCGKIWSNRRCMFLTPYKKQNGYLQVNLWKNGVKETCTVHRLVYEAFNGVIPEGLQVNHINEIKTDNRIENLNLMTPKENCNHGSRVQRMARTRGKSVILDSVESCGKYYFHSEAELARHFNIARETYREKVAKAKIKGSNRIKINGEVFIVKEA